VAEIKKNSATSKWLTKQGIVYSIGTPTMITKFPHGYLYLNRPLATRYPSASDSIFDTGAL